MKIIKFKKDKGNYYKVYFDNDIIIDLHDDVIVKYNLLSNKVLDEKKFNEITEYNDFLNGYYKSIKYINKKLRSELEIRKYLNKLDIKNKDIDKIIKLLYNDGYLNEETYLKAYINDKYNLSNYGPLKIKKELIILGYNEYDIDNYLNKFDFDIKIEKIINKKIKLNHKLSNDSLKTKILNDIINLGYEKNNIINILNNIKFDDDYKYLESELTKIKNKYSKRYNDKELEYKVINYLYRKGFNLEDIRRCYNEN